MIAPWIISAIIGLSILCGVGSRFIIKKTDNKIEEIVERVLTRVIEKCLAGDINVNIDLSPDTPDPDDKPDLDGRDKSYVMDLPELNDLSDILPDEKIVK